MCSIRFTQQLLRLFYRFLGARRTSCSASCAQPASPPLRLPERGKVDWVGDWSVDVLAGPPVDRESVRCTDDHAITT